MMSSLKKNLVYNMSYQVLMILAPLITTPYISRVLGSSGIGVYTYNYSIANYFVIFIMLGVNNYGNREIARSRDDKKELAATFWNIYAMQFCLGILIGSIYIGYCVFIAEYRLIAIIMIMYVFSAIFDVNWFFFGMEKFKITVLRSLLLKLLTTVLIFVVVKNSGDVWKYCVVMIGSTLLGQLVLWPCLLKEIPFIKPKWKNIRIHIKPNLFLFLTVIAVSLFKIMDKVMLGIISTTEQVGFYESSEKIIAIPTALITALGAVMLPRMSNIVKKSREGESALLQKSILFAMFLSSSICFGIMGISQEFVPLFYGTGFEECVYLYIILLPSCLFLAFANVIRTQYLLPHQMDKPYIISAFLGAGVNLTVNILLIPKWASLKN